MLGLRNAQMTLLPNVEKYSLLEGECIIQMGAGLSFRLVGPDV